MFVEIHYIIVMSIKSVTEYGLMKVQTIRYLIHLYTEKHKRLFSTYFNFIVLLFLN